MKRPRNWGNCEASKAAIEVWVFGGEQPPKRITCIGGENISQALQIYTDSLSGLKNLVIPALKKDWTYNYSYYPIFFSQGNRMREAIFKDLKKKNIFFAGIDFIDQKLNGDINITSPTGLKTFYDLSKINLAKTFWKELKA